MPDTVPEQPRISLIAAVARHGAIGRDNGLLWSDPEDQRHFRRVTLGHTVLMGRRTWESLPQRFRPLPGRRNVVVSRQPGWCVQGAEVVSSMEAAWQLLGQVAQIYVIGGAEVYAQALARADELVLTEIDADLQGDVHFPAWKRQEYIAKRVEQHTGADGTPFRFVTYVKKQGD